VAAFGPSGDLIHPCTVTQNPFPQLPHCQRIPRAKPVLTAKIAYVEGLANSVSPLLGLRMGRVAGYLPVLIGAALLLLGSERQVVGQTKGKDKPLDFDRNIATILADRCLECHRGPGAEGQLDLSQGKNRPAGWSERRRPNERGPWPQPCHAARAGR
jgi:hypothetical protein